MEPGNAQLSMTVLMTPDMANFSGNVHGGTLLTAPPRPPQENAAPSGDRKPEQAVMEPNRYIQ